MIDHAHIIERLGKGRKLIVVHGNADMDALGSAYALRCAFPDADIFAPSGLDRVTKMVAEKLDIAVLDDADPADYDLTVVVDTSSPDLFQREGFSIPDDTLIIDHHAPTGKWEGKDYHCDPERTSCCEIAYSIIKAAGKVPDRTSGLAILGGILTDGGHFQFADNECLKTFAEVMEVCDIPMDEAMLLVRAPMNMSERQAALKAAGRSRFERVGDMIVAVSFSTSYEAASCRALLAAGADVAFIGSQREDQFRVSGRATQEMVRRGVKLDEIMGELSGETFTDGGGHGGAAGITGTGDAEAMCHMCLQKTMERFRRIKAEIESQS